MKILPVIALTIILFVACNSTEQKKDTQTTSTVELTKQEKQLAEKSLSIILPKCLEISKTLEPGSEYGLSIDSIHKDMPEFVDSTWQITLLYMLDQPVESEWRWPIREEFKTFVKGKGFICKGGGDSMCHGTCTEIWLETEEGTMTLHLWLSTSMTQGVFLTINPLNRKT